MKIKAYTIIIILIVIFMIIVFFVITHSDTPDVPFAYLHEKSVIYDGWSESPNGDHIYITEYCLYPIDTKLLINGNDKIKELWIRGPISDPRYNKAFCWYNSCNFENNGPPPEWTYEKWLESERYYFYLEIYEEYNDNDLKGVVHHSSIWIIDTKTYHLYHIAGSS